MLTWPWTRSRVIDEPFATSQNIDMSVQLPLFRAQFQHLDPREAWVSIEVFGKTRMQDTRVMVRQIAPSHSNLRNSDTRETCFDPPCPLSCNLLFPVTQVSPDRIKWFEIIKHVG